MKQPKPAAVVALRIGADNLKAIDKLAKSLKVTRTAIITTAFEEFIADHAKRAAKAQSATKPAQVKK